MPLKNKFAHILLHFSIVELLLLNLILTQISVLTPIYTLLVPKAWGKNKQIKWSECIYLIKTTVKTFIFSHIIIKNTLF